MALLDVQHVKKIYKTRFKGNQVEALKDIHFTVEKGDYVAIMGESCSGKSTLLNILIFNGCCVHTIKIDTPCCWFIKHGKDVEQG